MHVLPAILAFWKNCFLDRLIGKVAIKSTAIDFVDHLSQTARVRSLLAITYHLRCRPKDFRHDQEVVKARAAKFRAKMHLFCLFVICLSEGVAFPQKLSKQCGKTLSVRVSLK